MAVWKAKTRDVVEALRDHFVPAADLASGTEEWAFLTEVPSTGASVHDAVSPWSEDGKVRSIDVLLSRNWSGKPNPYERIAVEVKVSRADFRRESDAKRAPWLVLAHRFAYAAPQGLLTPADIPDGCWLIEVSEHACDPTSRTHSRHRPTRVHWHRGVRGRRARTVETPPQLLAHLARAASRAQTRLVRADDSDVAAANMVELTRLRGLVQSMRDREHTNKDKVRSMLDLVAPLLPQECADCAQPLRLVPPQRYQRARWDHADATAALTCPQRWDPNPALVRQMTENG